MTNDCSSIYHGKSFPKRFSIAGEKIRGNTFLLPLFSMQLVAIILD